MANIFKPKKSTTAGLVPTPVATGVGIGSTGLVDGELAINIPDKKIYINNGGTIETISPNLDTVLTSGNTSSLGMSVGIVTATQYQTEGSFRAESSDSTERFEILYNEATDSLDFSYFTS